jgi:hypothetical protein
VLIRLLLALDTDEDLRDGLDDELKARGIKHCLLCESQSRYFASTHACLTILLVASLAGLPRLFCSGTVRWQTPPFAYSEDLKKGWVMAKNGDVVRRSEFGSSSV